MVEFQAVWKEVRKMCFGGQSLSDQCGQVLGEASFGEAVSLNGYPWRWSIYFAGPSKFSVNYRKEVFGQLPVLLLLLRAWCY